MKIDILDLEEQDLTRALEKGEFKSIANLEDRKGALKRSFQKTIKSRKSINIRILESDIHRLKTLAIEEGLPYQALISTVLHKYTTGKFVSKEKGFKARSK